MRRLIYVLITLLWTLSGFAQDSKELNLKNNDLKFIKDEKAYLELQSQIHQELKTQILSEISMIHVSYPKIKQYLETTKPEILASEVEFQEEEKGGKKTIRPQSVYFVWGYNRAWHSNADMTISTSEGTFTVHDAQGVDRPTPFSFEDYLLPQNISIPQYVVKVGYMFNEQWGIELSQDHMKWVFQMNETYEVTGDYSPTVYVTEEGEEWPVAQTFDEIKETGNMTWLAAEHTDGYNYVNVSAVYNLKVFETKNEMFRIDLRPNAGFGLMVPKTKVMMHRDSMWSWQGLDNKFHIAGFGAHVEAKVRATVFKNFFLEAGARVTHIKIYDALVNDQGGRMSQTPITSLQAYGTFGFYLPTGKKKNKKPKNLEF